MLSIEEYTERIGEEYMLQVENLLNLLDEFFTDETAELWFKTPNERLGGRTPLQFLKTPEGYMAIDLLILYLDNHGR